MAFLKNLSAEVKQYLIITGNYWSFTLTDGALRMMVVLYFHQLGYTPLQIASLFLFYEFFGIVTNLAGGWLGARLGLKTTMNLGLELQILALLMLLGPSEDLTILWVMAAQAISGIAKDLNKMSAKSAIKALVPPEQGSTLFRWVAILTGSKNTLKGIGFFLGGALLSWLGFQTAIMLMVYALLMVLMHSLFSLKSELGKSKNKPKFSQVFSNSSAINTLSAARAFLFGARDVWFVIGLPVYMSATLGWDHWSVGSFFAAWIIGYGLIQTQVPNLVPHPSRRHVVRWCSALAVITLLITMGIYISSNIGTYMGTAMQTVLIGGLFLFGAVFAINSAIHSYLIVSYADQDTVSMDVGFYYMANATGRLLGTILSGVIFQFAGLGACLLASTAFLFVSALISNKLPK